MRIEILICDYCLREISGFDTAHNVGSSVEVLVACDDCVGTAS